MQYLIFMKDNVILGSLIKMYIKPKRTTKTVFYMESEHLTPAYNV